MKKCAFRCLAVIAVICGLSAVSGASAIDFHANVLDPPPLSYSVSSITTLPFSVSFSTCAPGELPGGMTASGCFAGQNLTGFTWTNLQLTFANSPALGSQPASCGDPGSPFSIFSVTSCGLSPDGSNYILTFTNGAITSGEYFFIEEDGADPSAFGVGSGTVLGAVPEPNPSVLFGTGVMMFGLLVLADKRSKPGLLKRR
jgi:hypothetical protein